MNKKLLLALGIINLVLSVLFTGISRDREFSEYSIFLKYRPTLKLFYFSPVGESDQTQLSKEQEKEEAAYIEFVELNNLGDWDAIIVVFIQLIVTSFVFYVSPGKRTWLKLLLHFLGNIIISAFLLAFMVWWWKLWVTIALVAILLAANYLSVNLKFFKY